MDLGEFMMKKIGRFPLAYAVFGLGTFTAFADSSIKEIPRRLEECTPSLVMFSVGTTSAEIDAFVSSVLDRFPQLEQSEDSPVFVDCTTYLVMRIAVTASERANGSVEKGFVNFFYSRESPELENPQSISLPDFSFGIEFNL